MFNFVPPNATVPGFRIGPDGLPFGQGIAGPPRGPSNAIPEAWRRILGFEFGPAGAGLEPRPAPMLAFLGQQALPPGAPSAPNGPGNGDIHPVKNPLKCSGPNSSCELPTRQRANGVFLDPQHPPFRLCLDCFRRSQGRPPSGDDT